MCLLKKKNGLGEIGDISCLMVEEIITPRFTDTGAMNEMCLFLSEEFSFACFLFFVVAAAVVVFKVEATDLKSQGQDKC